MANRKDDNDYCIKDCDFDTAQTQCSIRCKLAKATHVLFNE